MLGQETAFELGELGGPGEYGEGYEYGAGEYGEYGAGEFGEYGAGEYGEYGEADEFGGPAEYGESDENGYSGEYGEFESFGAATEFGEYGELGLSEEEVSQLASELLEIASEEEFEQFIGGLARRFTRGAGA